jgi:hypothetical protein
MTLSIVRGATGNDCPDARTLASTVNARLGSTLLEAARQSAGN